MLRLIQPAVCVPRLTSGETFPGVAHPGPEGGDARCVPARVSDGRDEMGLPYTYPLKIEILVRELKATEIKCQIDWQMRCQRSLERRLFLDAAFGAQIQMPHSCPKGEWIHSISQFSAGPTHVSDDVIYHGGNIGSRPW